MFIQSFIYFHFLLVGILAASKYYDGPVRAYEFGFDIEGNQHRRESKDENGIVMGEFGFITADGVYRVTVYATDENGNFKVISMKNYKRQMVPMSRSSQPMIKLAPLTTTTSTIAPPPPQMESFVPTNYVQPRSQSFELLPEVPASNAASCSNCKIPEPKKPMVQPPTVKAQPQVYQTFNQKTVPSPTPAINKIEKVYTLMNAVTSPEKSIINSFVNNINNNNNKITSNQVTNDQIQSDAPALTVQAPLVQLNNEQIQNDSPVKKPNNDFRQAPVQRQPESPVLRQLTPVKPKQTTNYANNNINRVETLARSNFNNDIPAISTNSEDTKQQVLKKNNYQTQQPSPKTQTVDRDTKKNFNAANIKAMEQLLTGLLYQFNYTVGFHGHHETGDRDGNKEGGYFVVGRDGYKRTVDYKANEFGYQPIIKLENVRPEETPHEDTEKEAGLKGYEFNWFYV